LKGLHLRDRAVHFRGQIHRQRHSLRCLQTRGAVDVQTNVISAIEFMGSFKCISLHERTSGKLRRLRIAKSELGGVPCMVFSPSADLMTGIRVQHVDREQLREHTWWWEERRFGW
jgi:hypothetical protein